MPTSIAPSRRIHAPPRARGLALRLAMLALLAAALLPTFSRLLAPAGLTEWAALCQAAGGPSEPAPADLPAGHAAGDACALCTLAHTTPLLGGSALPAVAVLAYAPPAPAAPVAVRPRFAQARAPGARAPPSAA